MRSCTDAGTQPLETIDGGSPWEKYQDIKMNGDKPAGHVMLIIGYDDEMKLHREGRHLVAE